MQTPPESRKYGRDVFLYAEHGDSQCGTCQHWCGEKVERCALLGKALKADADDSCNLYAYGKPHDQPITEAMTPAEAGFAARAVRCENCRSFDPDRNHCGFFERLNDELGSWFDLDEQVAPKGCCTANKKKDGATGTIIELRVGIRRSSP